MLKGSVLFVDNVNKIKFHQFSSEDDLEKIMHLMTRELSEPYSIYTYRFFIYNWPKFCVIATDESGGCIAAIVCGMDLSKQCRKGYIAMLAVEEKYRRLGIGSRLVIIAIKLMIREGCDEVVLETEVTNAAAISLYERLGFSRNKRLFRYYLNGVDAFQLKLWLTPSYSLAVH
ncbi:unnamed protein product [Protopolystoma xenopodis]|uniref:N-acetyltransferase domain-containing protein n=1 Tax=Protopolystoma xenopodis TaxID=117903 RepID=A0A448WP95_9PLAT|nr:unnamed protein product [Protopolystoma xenopodis]